MSRIGKRPVKILDGVLVSIIDSKITAKSSYGEACFMLPVGISAKIDNGNVYLDKKKETKLLKSLHGTSARMVRNIILDTKDGFKKVLDFKGTGYRARVENNNLMLNMGYSHEISLVIPNGIIVSVVKNKIIVEGVDRIIVGQFSATVRNVRLPEVYKGKGIKYETEVIKKKAGKAAQVTTGK